MGPPPRPDELITDGRAFYLSRFRRNTAGARWRVRGRPAASSKYSPSRFAEGCGGLLRGPRLPTHRESVLETECPPRRHRARGRFPFAPNGIPCRQSDAAGLQFPANRSGHARFLLRRRIRARDPRQIAAVSLPQFDVAELSLVSRHRRRLRRDVRRRRSWSQVRLTRLPWGIRLR